MQQGEIGIKFVPLCSKAKIAVLCQRLHDRERVAVRVQYTYRHSYCDLRGYSDRGGRGENDSTCTVYRHSYCDLRGYFDRGG